ncbi:MAG: hypothetical protein KFF73_01525 [Cyclobacteriaceae bacterium]|nr:hypothetical protein [Cyclobacteriaceae bacterium]
MKNIMLLASLCVLTFSTSKAQFVDHFDGPYRPSDPGSPEGWAFASGDGAAEIDFQQKDGYASILVDATKDKRNIWWALIRRQVTGLDMQELVKPKMELRVEARIRVSHAPRRLNLHFNHQRTTDFHSHLMEFDIPDTINWHTISMTTRNFETQPGDNINVQMALMDWGWKKYRVDIDYIKVDVTDSRSIHKDLGNKLPYHPPVADKGSFKNHVPAFQDAMIDEEFRDMNFNNWGTEDGRERVRLLTVSGTQTVILRWDFSALEGKKISGPGLLELSTWDLLRSPDFQKDFGMVRVVEILGGNPEWEQERVTFDSFCAGDPLDEVLNTQMIIDYEVNAERTGSSLFTISQPVLQRLIDGKTRGIAIRPLGAVNASFYSTEYQQGKFTAKLHFNTD